jgi:hypothetical protein
MEGFHDQEAIQALIEQIIDVLRPIGVTVDPRAIQFGIVEGQTIVQLQGLVRAEAKERAEADIETKESFNQMMAEQNRMMQEEKRSEITELTDDPDKLVSWLFEEQECSHERVHEGLCLDCSQEVS